MSKQSDLVNITQGDADINGGTIDGTVIGGSTPAAISGTTGQFGTSLNVDGTITSDGLTVDGTSSLNGDITMNTATPQFKMYSPSSVNGYDFTANVSDTVDGGLNIRDIAGKRLVQIGSNNDISFYEDTGTTPKFFWDASAEALGIGTSSPVSALDVTGTVTADGLTVDGNATISSASPTLLLEDTVGAAQEDARIQVSASLFSIRRDSDGAARISIGLTTGDIYFYEDTGTTPKFFWDASAEAVLIGTTTAGASILRVVGLPTSSAGLSSGDIWNDAGTLKIV